MAVCRPVFTDEEHAVLVVCTIRVGKMSCGLGKTLQMRTVKTESGLGYKSSPSPSPSPSPAKMDLSPDSSRPTTSLEVVAKVAKQENRQHYSQAY